MRERAELLFRLRVDENGVPLIEGAPLGVLTGKADGIAFEKQRARGESFGKAVIDGTLAVTHFGSLLEQLGDFWMNMKAGGNAHQRVGGLGQLFSRQGGG